MGFSVEFIKPYFFIILPFLIGFFIWAASKKQNIGVVQKRVSITLRCILSLLLVLSLADPHVKQFSKKTTTIFVLDSSDSIMSVEEGQRFINDAQKFRTDNDIVGVVCFGANGVIESMPSTDQTNYGFQSYMEKDFTNISSGLNLAHSIVGDKTKKRIVLLSDGLENVESAAMATKLLADDKVVVDVYPLLASAKTESQITQIKVPKYMNKNIEFDIEIGVYSTAENISKLYLYKGNQLIHSSDVSLREGDNKFIFKDTSDVGGGVIYRAEILPLEDEFRENNMVYAHSYVADIPSVLLLDHEESSDAMKALLEQTSVNVVAMPSVSAPTTIDRLSVYDAIILCDVPMDFMPDEFDDLLESYVKNVGGGVLVTGGENSYAPGGYYQTAMETLLPVDMQLKDKSKIPDLAMVVCLDRSGSMSGANYGVSKLDLAKEAVIRSVDTLGDKDSFGLIAFDDTPIWQVPFEKVVDKKDAIKTNIAQISLGGGTSILPSLDAAVTTLEAADAKLKHIVLLTDGQAETTGYEKVLSRMDAGSITLSSVAVGSDSDMKLLKFLAEKGNGRYYYSDEFTDLPHIFAKETFLAGKTYFNNDPFFPVVKTVSPVLAGVDKLPSLGGYVASTAKLRADVVLVSEKDEPVLASWQYGLGRSIAWTSDVSGRWAKDWLATDEGIALLRNSVSWLIRKQNISDVTLDVTTKGKNSEITVTFPFSDGVEKISGTLVAEDKSEQKVNFVADSPGVFKAEITSSEAGAYVAALELEKLSGKENIAMGLSIPYSEEYNVRNKNGLSLLQKIASSTGGVVIEKPEEAFRPIEMNVYGDVSIALPLLIASLLLFIADIAARRFGGIFSRLETMLSKRRKVREAKKEANLLANKSKKKVLVDIDKTSLIENEELDSTKKTNKIHKGKKQSNTETAKEENISDVLMRQKKNRSGG